VGVERGGVLVVNEDGGCVDAGLCSELVLTGTGVMQRCATTAVLGRLESESKLEREYTTAGAEYRTGSSMAAARRVRSVLAVDVGRAGNV